MSLDAVRRIHGGEFKGASPPEIWSYTQLRTVESCPRRYWLQYGEYEFAGSSRGYPRRYTTAAVVGIVAHRSIEKVLKALSARRSTPTIEVLRELGGLRQVVQVAAEATLQDLAGNPRMVPHIDSLRRAVQPRLDGAITVVQQTLRRTVPVRATEADTQPSTPGLTSASLRPGSYAEISVSHEDLSFRAIIDHLQLGDESARLTDFKTGRPSPDHLDQLVIYGVVWRREQRNPRPDAPITVVVEYGDHRVEQTLASSDLDERESALANRLQAATEALTGDPLATLEPETCRACDVRHLCDDYWTDIVATSPIPCAAERRMCDLAAVVIERRSPSAYEVRLPDDSGISLFTGEHELNVGAEFRAHDLIYLSPDQTGSDGPALQVTSVSELFVLE